MEEFDNYSEIVNPTGWAAVKLRLLQIIGKAKPTYRVYDGPNPKFETRWKIKQETVNE